MTIAIEPMINAGSGAVKVLGYRGRWSPPTVAARQRE
jgi:methionine aminopeptidase